MSASTYWKQIAYHATIGAILGGGAGLGIGYLTNNDKTTTTFYEETPEYPMGRTETVKKEDKDQYTGLAIGTPVGAALGAVEYFINVGPYFDVKKEKIVKVSIPENLFKAIENNEPLQQENQISSADVDKLIKKFENALKEKDYSKVKEYLNDENVYTYLEMISKGTGFPLDELKNIHSKINNLSEQEIGDTIKLIQSMKNISTENIVTLLKNGFPSIDTNTLTTIVEYLKTLI